MVPVVDSLIFNADLLESFGTAPTRALTCHAYAESSAETMLFNTSRRCFSAGHLSSGDVLRVFVAVYI